LYFERRLRSSRIPLRAAVRTPISKQAMSDTGESSAAAACLPRLGWIGTGIMGGAICGRLLEAGFPLTVSSRSRNRAEPLLARGASWAATPGEVAAASDVVFSCVGYPGDVRQVVLGADGVLSGMRPGTIFVDMTTSEPALAEQIAAAAAAIGVEALDAPVSGGDVGAREGRLTVMVGGTAAAMEKLAAVWRVVAGRVVHCGPPGSGQHTKMANQVAIASTMIGMCEALLYASRAGLDLATTLEAIGPGAAGSWSLQNLAPRLLRGDLAPGFMVEHFLKDLGIALAECRRMGLVLPGTALAEQLYRAANDQGHGRSGTQALVVALASLSALEWPPSSAG
jgi:3-hydroxyisobutyrate dehydrogenase